MNCRKAILGACFFAFTLSFGVFASRAQDEPQPTPDSPPKPAGRASPAIEIGQQEGGLQPDSSPLTGMQDATLGYPEIRHSYWVPGIQFSSNLASNAYGQSGSSNWYADNYFIGNLTLLEAWSRATFTVNYSGGGYVSAGSRGGNGDYQELGLEQNFHTKRWLIQIVDRFSYLPQNSFGFGGGTNLGIPGVGGSLGTTNPSLGGNYIPNQSIYSGFGAAYNNAGALQATYALSRRGSVTVSGSYGILRFVEAGNVDSNNTIGSIGYNFAINRKDTVGLFYRFSGYQFPGSPQAYADNVMSVAYGRKLTGRLALRLFVGPEITQYRIPIGTASRNTGVSATASLSYGFPRGGFSLNYIHGLSGGSGVLTGSNLDEAIASANRKLTKVWTGNVHFGYAHNSTLGGSLQLNSSTYDSWFVGGGVSRPIGRNFNFGLAYTAHVGSSSQAGCTGAVCNPTNLYQIVNVNFQWHPRPFVLP